MKPASALAIYLLFWSLTLFAILPFGVRTHHDDGTEPVAGQADSAPTNPRLLRKALWTTIVATILFALFYANYTARWIDLDDIPGWEDTGPYKPD